MGLTTSLFTGLSGLAANAQSIEVAGNNIANVNTTAFKSDRLTFETQFSQTLNAGAAPSGEIGGVNPTQIGQGVRIGAITSDFTQGSISATGVATDLAVSGDGFFVVNELGDQRFTRNGNFSLDSEFNLTTASGARVQGFGIDDDFNIVGGTLQDVNIPLGVVSIAEATSDVAFTGNFNVSGPVATQGSTTSFEPLFDTLGAPATGATALEDLRDAAGNAPFALGDVITITEARRGPFAIPDRTFEVNAVATPGVGADAAGATFQDFADFLEDIFGVDTSAAPAGAAISPAGVLGLTGNIGTANGISFDDSNLIVNAGTSVPTTPLALTTVAAEGESVGTTVGVFDSLGNELQVQLTAVLVGSDNTGNQFQFFATSQDDSDLDAFLSTGTVSFDTNGQFINATDATVTIDRALTGAENPLQVDFQFSDLTALVDEVDNPSTLVTDTQDGFGLGVLDSFAINPDGIITGFFDNGEQRDLGQIPVATFANNNGLVQSGGSLFEAGVNSGQPNIVVAGTAGAGSITASALELSNVELSEEFVDLITASTGFSASSRVITTSDQLIQELLQLVR